MSLALKILNGTITQIGSADFLDVNSIRQNAGGNPNLLSWATNVLTLGVGTDTIQIPGSLEVDGTMTVSSTATYEGNVNLGNGGDTINIGSGATDTVRLNSDLVIVNPTTTSIGSGTGDYVSELWQAKVVAAPATVGNTAVALNATTTTAAGAWAVGVDTTALTVSAPANGALQTVLNALDAAIGGTSETLQEAYDNGPDILQTAADGGIQISRGTSTDTHVLALVDAGTEAQPVFTVSKTGASSANAVSISTGINVTGGNALFVNNLGAGSALTVQDGGSNVLNIDAAGNITATPTSGQNFVVTTAGAGKIDLNSTDSVEIDAAVASNFTVTGANLTLSTVTSGDVNVTAAGVLNMDAASATLDTTGAVAINAAAASNFSVTGGNFTLSTITSGNVNLTAAGVLNMDGASATLDATGAVSIQGAAASDFTTVGANLTLETLTSGDLNLYSVAVIDMNAASATLDVSGTFSIDGGAGTSNITQANGALTITAGSASTWSTSSGALSITSADQLNLTAAADSDVVMSTSETGGLSLTTVAPAAGGTAGLIQIFSTAAAAGKTASDITIQSFATSSGVSGDVSIGSLAGTISDSGGLVLYAGDTAPTPVAGGINILAGDDLVLAASSTTDITFQAQGGTAIPFNVTGANANLVGFTATSIVGALNELKAGPSAVVVEFATSTAAAGDVVKITATDDDLAPADADDGESATIGIQINGSAPFRVVTNGLVLGVLTGATAGTRYFVSETAGDLTSTAPTNPDLVRRIGWAKNATDLVVLIGEGSA